MKIFSIKTRQLMCVIFLSLFCISGANGQFNKVGEFYIPAGMLETFQKEGSYYLAAENFGSIEIDKWNGNSFEYYQNIIFPDDVFYLTINIFYQNNEPHFILSGPGGTDIYMWNEAEESFTNIQNIPNFLPFGSDLEYFEIDGTPWFAFFAADDKIWVYEWNGTQFENKTNFICPGATLKSIYLNNTLYFITTFFEAPTKIYKWNGVRFMMSNDFQVSTVNKTLGSSFTFNDEQLFLFYTSPWTAEAGDTFEIDRWNGENLEQVYTGTTNTYWFNNFYFDNKQFVVLSEDPDEGFYEDIYEWKDNQLVPYQIVTDEYKTSAFSKYFTIDGKLYLIICRWSSSMTLYEWEGNEQKDASISDVICALQVLSGKQCSFQSDDDVVDMKDVIQLLSEISR